MYNAVLFNEWASNYYEVLKNYEDVDIKMLHPEIQNFLNGIMLTSDCLQYCQLINTYLILSEELLLLNNTVP